MAVDERRRSELYTRLEAALGPDAAATMFEMMPQPDSEPATRSDLALLRGELERRFDRVDARFEQVDARFDAVLERMDERFAVHDARFQQVDARFDAVLERMEERFAAQDDRMDERFAAQDDRMITRMDELESRLTAVFERRITDAVTTQTRTLVFSQLGAVVTIAALAFGLR